MVKLKGMVNQFQNQENKGFIKLIIIVVIALILLRYFNITVSGILSHLNLTLPQVAEWFKDLWEWFKGLWNSVK